MGLNTIICGGHNPESRNANVHAKTYYESVRRQTGDIDRISKNTGFTVEQVSLVKSYIFYCYHNLGRGYLERFYPDYIMGESWRRLSGSNKSHIQPHDLLLLQHELLEIRYIMEGFTQSQAPIEASKRYNYRLASTEFYRRQGFDLR